VASAFSALGLAVSDLTTIAQVTELALAPFDPAVVSGNFARLEQEAIESLKGHGTSADDAHVQRVLELRYKGQVHQVDTPVPEGDLTRDDLEDVIAEFERRYEAHFGRGSAFREAGIELVTYRVLATSRVHTTRFKPQEVVGEDASAALIGREDLYWRELGAEAETAIYGSGLRPGMEFDGPAVIRLQSTTALIHPGQHARIDEYGNVRVTTIQ
jgi:N-methylhydantoinase A